MKEQVFQFRHSLVAPFIKSKFIFDEKRIEVKNPTVFLGIIKAGYDETHIKVDRISGISVEKKINILLIILGVFLALGCFPMLFTKATMIWGIFGVLGTVLCFLEFIKYAVVISSSGERTRVRIHKLDKNEARKMVEKIKDLIE